MKVEMIGTFVFRNDGDGCISGKWVNNGETKVYPESAKKDSFIEEDSDEFCGVYLTSWIEENARGREAISGKLEIKRKPGTDKSTFIYNLKWVDLKGADVFDGIGMRWEGLLVGSYWEY